MFYWFKICCRGKKEKFLFLPKDGVHEDLSRWLHETLALDCLYTNGSFRYRITQGSPNMLQMASFRLYRTIFCQELITVYFILFLPKTKQFLFVMESTAYILRLVTFKCSSLL